ncbi:histidinol-phosphate transaminase [Streptomyces sp. NPDC004539]|uniref:pyridoxal phosphate-dependent aminotransferase n=1 Tax=Streptomyces sp. NPDC004539 TaxID=3154280 RepID=UPI0033AFF4F6
MRTRTPNPHVVTDGSPLAPLLLHRSENPWGASPKAVEAARAELLRVHRYPDPRHTALIDALTAHYQVPPGRVAVGNGLDELIMMLAIALRGIGRAVVNEATYQGYPKSLEAVGLRVVQIPLEHHRVGTEALVEEMNRGAALVFVCNPHNPTGSVLDAGEVTSLCETARATGSHLVFDEAYAEFADESFTSALPWARQNGCVSVLRTFSKAYGLASLRVGALIGGAETVSRIETVQDAMPYHVNRLAQAAARAALEDQAFLEQTRVYTATARMTLCCGLDRLGIRYLPSQTNFVTAHLPGRVAEVTRQLLAEGIHVRDASDMGMPGWMRISVGTPSDVLILMNRLETALAACAVP